MKNKLLLTTCIHCGLVNHIHDNVDGKVPTPGDISFCWDCGGVAKYSDHLKLIAVTDEELDELKQNREFQELQHARMESTSPAELLRLWKLGMYGSQR